MPKELEEKEKSTETENQGQDPTEDKNQGVQFDDGEDIVVEVKTEETETKTETPEVKETETPAETEQVNQEAVEKKIGKLTYKRRVAEEKVEELSKELAARDAKIAELEGKRDEIVVPPLPDPLDEQYQQKMQAREDAITKKAAFDAQKQLEYEKQQEAIEAKRQATVKKISENTTNMYKSAEKLGFKTEDFQAADLKVSTFIKGRPDIANFILEHEDAPLLVQYLSNDVESLDKLSRMSDMSAAVFLATEVTAKAQGLKPKPSDAPEPLELVKGKGGGEDESPFLKGVDFE